MAINPAVMDAPAPVGLRVIEVTPKWAMGEFEQCITMIWSGQPDHAAMQRRAEELLDLAKRFPGKCALVEVVESTAKPPNQDTRRVAMEVFRKLGNDLSAIAFVLEGNEMRTALIRAVITGMLFFVKQPQPSRVFKRLDELLEWLRPRLQPSRTGFDADLAAAFEHLRALMHARGAAASP